jgi:hypothetical protein
VLVISFASKKSAIIKMIDGINSSTIWHTVEFSSYGRTNHPLSFRKG